MATIKSTLGLKDNVAEFTNRQLAFNYANRCIKQHVVMLGDNDMFWVACFADAQKLERLGYQIA